MKIPINAKDFVQSSKLTCKVDIKVVTQVIFAEILFYHRYIQYIILLYTHVILQW